MRIKSQFKAEIANEELNLVTVGGAGTNEAVYEALLSARAKVARGLSEDADARVVIGAEQGRSIEASDEFTTLPFVMDVPGGMRVCDSFVRTSEIAMIWVNEGETYLCLNDPQIAFSTLLTPQELIARTKTTFNEKFVPAMKQNVFISAKYPNLAEALQFYVEGNVMDAPTRAQ